MRIAFQADAMPDLKVQQAPYPVVVISVIRSVFLEQSLDGRTFKIPAFQTARLEIGRAHV